MQNEKLLQENQENQNIDLLNEENEEKSPLLNKNSKSKDQLVD